MDRFFDALIPPLVPLMATRGGPIVALQVENEYGSYGNDKTYLRHLADGLRRRGGDVLLFTSDGPSDLMLTGGTLPDIFKVANFGSRTGEAFAKLREHQPEGPLMCGEFWCGWFDHWGDAAPHHTRSPEDVARELDAARRRGSVNFTPTAVPTGFMAGANYTERLQRRDQLRLRRPAERVGEPPSPCRAQVIRTFPYAELPPLYAPCLRYRDLDRAVPLIGQAERSRPSSNQDR